MAPPFTTDQFFQVFAAYNTAVWPAQLLLLAAAVFCLALAFRPEPWAGRAIVLVLAALWAWMGVAYHWAFFAAVNPAARLFGALFLLEAAILLWAGFRTPTLRFEPRRDLFGAAGGVLLTYALVVYPLLGAALGHRYPAQPTFGLPCPTTIFTVGMLIWLKPKVLWGPLVVPLVWSGIGMTAVFYFGVLEDIMLPVATLAVLFLGLFKNRRARSEMA